MRGCYFEYAGISSKEFGLILAFVDSKEDTLISGGEFELITDYTPYSSEALLYGKKFEQPLEFEVDIVIDEDTELTHQDLLKIKDWLFGQDGWKTFRYDGEGYEGYYLKCLFIPKETILGGENFIGLRCTLSNVSPYWYEDTTTIQNSDLEFISSADGAILTAQLPTDSSDFIESIFPNITLRKTSPLWDDFIIGTIDKDTTLTSIDLDNEDYSKLKSGYRINYPAASPGLVYSNININTKYSTAKCKDQKVPGKLIPIDGVTTFKIDSPDDRLIIIFPKTNTKTCAFDISFEYNAMVRLGGL